MPDAAVTAGEAPAVDAHAHIFAAIPFAEDAHSRPAYDYPVEAYLADLDRHGITHGVIAAASLFGTCNDYTLAALEAHPNLRGTVILPPETGAPELRALAARGAVGVRLVWRRLAELPDIGAEPWRGFLRRLADCGLHVELLAGGARLPALLPQFAQAGVEVVLDHFGVPSREAGAACAGMDATIRAVQDGRAWVKISAGFRLAPGVAEACTERLLREAGPGRLLWGSDAPFVNHETQVDFAGAIDLYRRLVPDPETRRAIDRTALALYFK